MRVVPPDHLDRISNGELVKFKAHLTACGAEVLEPNRQNEVLRVRVEAGTFIVVRRANDRLTWPLEVEAMWSAYKRGRHVRLGNKTRLKPRTLIDIATIAQRDGWECFYCEAGLEQDTATIEHLVARVHRGPNHISNKFLSCADCNCRAGHLSAPEKIRLRDELRRPKCSS